MNDTSSKLINRRDLEFMLYELLDVESLTRRARFADHSRETFEAAIDLGLRIAASHFAPHNRKSDLHEPTFDGERVHVIPEIREALRAYCDAGLMGAAHDVEWGGMQLPQTVACAVFAPFNSASIAMAAYPFLTIGAANLINAFGTPEQKSRYLPYLSSGRFFGTMCLSEPQAGSSLADITTTARLHSDGTYRIFGQKMWISGGDHDLTENIVHLVLAKIEGAPPGVKGISLFVVPKFLAGNDGSTGRRNDVAVAGLNHKMGYRGTTNCVLNFGERGGAIGYLLGEPHKGLSSMFHMMNESRIGVGLGATMLGYTGYLHALDYARCRAQGRLPSAKNPMLPQIPIVQHADVRRMLLAQKAYVEGALALCLYAARLVDERKTSESVSARERAESLLGLLTPIVKSWPSKWCLEANDLAIQVYGGYGYTREFPVEQFYRDNRLNPIHEGAHGIQALDLLGRKAVMKDGAALTLITNEMSATAEEARHCADPHIGRCGGELARMIPEIVRVTRMARDTLAAGDAERALANASIYLEMMGHTVVAWLWLRQALLASARLKAASPADRAFYLGKLQACRYFFTWELPKCRVHADILGRQDTTCLDMRDEWF
jgi:alkylation response protein AidB-like acyl-CoA dehydrogenase